MPQPGTAHAARPVAARAGSRLTTASTIWSSSESSIIWTFDRRAIRNPFPEGFVGGEVFSDSRCLGKKHVVISSKYGPLLLVPPSRPDRLRRRRRGIGKDRARGTPGPFRKPSQAHRNGRSVLGATGDPAFPSLASVDRAGLRGALRSGKQAQAAAGRARQLLGGAPRAGERAFLGRIR